MRTLNKNNLVARSLSLPKGLATAAVSISLFLAACGDDNKNAGGTVEDQEVIAISDKTVSGVSQKGPFVNGSSVTVQELDGETLAQTGNSYEGKIKNDMGEFSVKVAKLASQYALLKANGFYRNEVSGEKSKSQVTLYALTDLSNRDEVNVNLLTHLEYERSLYLAADDSVTVSVAKKQAEREVLASFGIDGDFKSAEDLNIFGEDEGAAALLAISVLMQGDLNEADFSERLADYAADMETDGKWDDSKTATEIADWAAAKSLGQSLSYIREKITNWGLSADVPAFEKYVDNFWWQNYGLGTCNKKREGEVKKNENALSRNYSTYFICESGAWRVAYDTEYDTYQQKCDKDGKIVFGNVNKDYAYDCDVQRWRHASNVESALGGCVEKRFGKVAETEGVYYICQKREWRKAADIEKDTYGWKTGNDADVKYGDVVKTNCYVFEDSVWRSGESTDCSLGLRGCTALRQDTVGKVGSTYYICKSSKWVEASAIEYDTYRWAAGKDGDSKPGSVNTANCYVYENKTWRSGNKTDCSLGLRGCTTLRQDTVGKGKDDVWYKCVSQTWRAATNIEKDTATWGVGEFNGEVRTGQINKNIYYIYETDKKIWRNATTLEKDTYDHENNKDWEDGVDGEIKKGSVTNTIYVFDATAWRAANNIEEVLGGCVAAIQDSVGKVGDVYYICNPRKWNIATTLQYDTYKQECSEFGQIVHGNINADYVYFCYGEEWKRFYGNESISYGKLEDERDGRIYRTVQIGDQTWMAENLNLADESIYPSMIGKNWCMANLDSCEKYGRYYMWSAAIDSIYWAEKGETCGYKEFDYYEDNELLKMCRLPKQVKGICPSGWHLPSQEEWSVLKNYVNDDSKTLLAKGIIKSWRFATDDYGFSVLPGSFYHSSYGYMGFEEARILSSDIAVDPTSACVSGYVHCANAVDWYINQGMIDISGIGMDSYEPVRCIKDEE
ncbi:FISUMP domain-containing protein [uncultured Fibrobacter sp.]|uniref:FISUMP domain-containing protein n=1 Tax=uncultured Fibrobacter sp. TaxID=261512 RepID=UPI00261778C3|nr:FISUMP domain-containing protein [uncultured Fibrobacter sp.]